MESPKGIAAAWQDTKYLLFHFSVTSTLNMAWFLTIYSVLDVFLCITALLVDRAIACCIIVIAI